MQNIQVNKALEARGLPVPTGEQMAAAVRYVQAGPARHLGLTALNLTITALHMPLSKRERAANKYQPRRTRGEHLQVEARAEAVQQFVEAAEASSPQELVATFAQAGRYSYDAIPKMAGRVARFLRSTEKHGERRIPRHIRDKMIGLSAMAQGVGIAFPEVHGEALQQAGLA